LHNDYFEGTKEILPTTHLEIDDNTFCDLSISQHWETIYRYDSSCGAEKTRTWRRKWGWSRESSNAIEAELGFSLSIGLASLSPKITTKINKSLTISIEDEVEEQTKFTAPKCGKHEITIYQLISEWNIKISKKIKRRWREPLLREFNPSIYRIAESNATIESPKIYPELSDCNCKDMVQYDGNATLAINSGVVNLPCKRLSDNKIEIYGIHNKLFSKGDIVKLEELPIEISKSLHSSRESKILTYGEKLPILNATELISEFEKLVFAAKEILLKYLGQDLSMLKKYFGENYNLGPLFFRLLGDFALTYASTASSASFHTLKNFSMYDKEKLTKVKESLNKVRNGDLSELSEQLQTSYRSYNENEPLFLLTLDLFIKEEYKEEAKAQLLSMFRELSELANEFYESCKDSIIDFLRKLADILFRLIDDNDIQEAVLMRKEFVSDGEDQLNELKNKAKRLLDLTKEKWPNL
jgi:hypothetical protein